MPSPMKLSENRVTARKPAGKTSIHHDDFDVGGALADQHAPACHRLLNAQAQEAQEAFQQDHLRHGQRHVDHDRPQRIGDDVAPDDRGGTDPAGPRRLDELLPLDAQRLAPDDARHVQPFDRPDRDEDQDDVAAEEHHQQDHEEHERQRIEHIDQPHHDAVDPAAEIPRRRPIQHADRQADRRGDQPDHQRDLPAVERADQQVAPVGVGAEQVSGRPVRRRHDGVPEDLVQFERDQQRPDEAGQHHQQQHDAGGDGGLVAQQAPAGVAPQAAAPHSHRPDRPQDGSFMTMTNQPQS